MAEIVDIILTRANEKSNNGAVDNVYVKVKQGDEIKYFKACGILYKKATANEVEEIKKANEISLIEKLPEKITVFALAPKEKKDRFKVSLNAQLGTVSVYHNRNSLIKLGDQYMQLVSGKDRFKDCGLFISENYSLIKSVKGVSEDKLKKYLKNYSLNKKGKCIRKVDFVKQITEYFTTMYNLDYPAGKIEQAFVYDAKQKKVAASPCVVQ